MYNKELMSNKTCLIPAQKSYSTYHQQRFRNQDQSTNIIGGQAVLNAAGRHQNLQTARYGKAARKILEDVRTPPEWQRLTKGFFHAINTRRINTQRWAILDSGAISHFLIISRCTITTQVKGCEPHDSDSGEWRTGAEHT